MVNTVKEIKSTHAARQGVFNPAIDKIVARWGFDGGSSERCLPVAWRANYRHSARFVTEAA